MDLSRANFLDLLKGNNNTTTPLSITTKKNNSKNTNDKNEKQNNNNNSDDDDDDEGHEKSGIGSTSWSVLKDSYLTDKSLALKVFIFSTIILLLILFFNFYC